MPSALPAVVFLVDNISIEYGHTYLQMMKYQCKAEKKPLFFATNMEESTNAFVVRAIKETMERDIQNQE